MGSSARKKKEKKKDFQKTKLKVGKAKPKSDNFTDTSFKAKAVVVNQQSITTSAPSAAAQFGHHLSLLTSHSTSQCRDSLAYITSTISTAPPDTALPQPLGVILPSLLPLIYHKSPPVRTQLLKLFRTLPPADVQDDVGRFIMHVRLGMTNIAPDIRIDSVEVLSWLLGVAGQEVVSCPGGWPKLLKCFLAVLGWEEQGNSKTWTSESMNVSKTAGSEKVVAKQLQVFGQFLKTGMAPSTETRMPVELYRFPLRDVQRHMLPQRSNCYAYLNLFGPSRDEDSEIYEDRQDRQKWVAHFQPLVEQGIDAARMLGGEIGRAAAVVNRIFLEAMQGYGFDD